MRTPSRVVTDDDVDRAQVALKASKCEASRKIRTPLRVVIDDDVDRVQV